MNTFWSIFFGMIFLRDEKFKKNNHIKGFRFLLFLLILLTLVDLTHSRITTCDPERYFGIEGLMCGLTGPISLNTEAYEEYQRKLAQEGPTGGASASQPESAETDADATAEPSSAPTQSPVPQSNPQNVERDQQINSINDALTQIRRLQNQEAEVERNIRTTQNQTRIQELNAQRSQIRAQRASVETQASTLLREGFDAGTLSTSDIELLLLQLPDLDLNSRNQLRNELSGRSSCNPDSWWSFVCNFFSEDRAKDIEVRRLNARIQSETVDAQSANEYNTQVLSVLNDELAVWAPGINCGIDTSDCREQLSNIACSDEECENQVRVAQSLIRQAEGSIRIPRSGMIRAAELLQVRDSSFALASQLQDWLGFEFSLISEGSGIDQILSWGTPEQVCLAKVDSFISVNGLQVEGQVFDEEDEFSGFTSRMRACDNRQFDICADLRAERSGVYFNNSISLVVHLMVKNSRDHDQEVVLNAEFFNDGVRESYNIFNFTDEVQGNSLILSPGQRRSFSLHLSEFQVFADQDIGSLSGNVLLSVFRKVGEGGVVSDQNLDYAIDYPIMSMISGQSSSQSRREEALNSGAEFTEGTTQATSSLLQRVSID